jgi:23S rRNA pseudouridine2605 synthase
MRESLGQGLEGTRLNRFLAECGLGARRKVEDLIRSGRITVDGLTVMEPGVKIYPAEEVALDGVVLSPIGKRYFIFNKPRGFVCAVSDKYDKTVFDLLNERLKRLGLFPVGRLDKESEGLLLLTNDGELAQELAHPSGGVVKRYEILLDHPLEASDIEAWSSGAIVEGKWVKPISVNFLNGKKSKEWIRVSLREGRKRELRVIADTHGFKVLKLVRTAIGQLEIGDLRPGEIREISREEIVKLTGIGGGRMNKGRKCKPLIVTIDGPAGSGKSTVAKGAAARTGLRYLDTGKLYRAITIYLSGKGIPPVESETLKAALGKLELKLEGGRVLIKGEDVTEDLHTPKIDSIVSLYAALPAVRERLLLLQRAQAGPPGLIADGRDMGSVVFPEADLKIFLTADARERAQRRYLEQSARGERVELEQVLSVVMERDRTDSTRPLAPLVIPFNAIVIDTTDKPAREVIEEIVQLAENTRRRIGEAEDKDAL